MYLLIGAKYVNALDFLATKSTYPSLESVTNPSLSILDIQKWISTA